MVLSPQPCILLIDCVMVKNPKTFVVLPALSKKAASNTSVSESNLHITCH